MYKRQVVKDSTVIPAIGQQPAEVNPEGALSNRTLVAVSYTHLTQRQNYCLNDLRGKELRDMTVGVLGTGRIGQAVMERLEGFGCKVLAYDRNQKAGADYVSFHELLKKSDIVTLHIPLAEDTRHMIGYEELEMMKEEALLINTGRGALVDTAALVEALKGQKIGGAALDVLEGEEGIDVYKRQTLLLMKR